MNTNNRLDIKQIKEIKSALKIPDDEFFEFVSDASYKSEVNTNNGQVKKEISISFLSENSIKIVSDSPAYNQTRLLLTISDKTNSFNICQCAHDTRLSNYPQKTVEEMYWMDDPVSQNKTFLISTALRLDKDKVSHFANNISEIEPLPDAMNIKLNNDKNIKLMSYIEKTDDSLYHQRYNITVSDGQNKEISIPTFSDNEYTFKVLEEIKNMPMTEIEKNLQKFADGEKSFSISKILDTEEITISKFNQHIKDLEIYESGNRSFIEFKLENKEILIEKKENEYKLSIDKQEKDCFPDGKYIAAELEGIAEKLESEMNSPKHNMENTGIDF